MPEPRKILMPVDDEGAVRQMEVEAFRQIADGIKSLNNDMRDVRERLIRIESNQLDRTVQDHANRIAALESDRQRRDGALGIAVRAPGIIPWIITVVAAMFAAIQWVRHA